MNITELSRQVDVIAPVRRKGHLIEQVGGGYLDLTFGAEGYWSDSIFRLGVRRSWDNDGVWEVSLSHSSGGRDKDEVESDIEATKNFVSAYLAVATVAELIESNTDTLEEEYQRQEVIAQKRDEQLKREKQLRYDQDLPIGKLDAKHIVEKMISDKKDGEEVKLEFKERGEDYVFSIFPIETWNGSIVWRMNGTPYSRKEITALIANSSHNAFYAWYPVAVD